ncbi:MAG: YdcF family protein, partial [Microbacterium sp.]
MLRVLALAGAMLMAVGEIAGRIARSSGLGDGATDGRTVVVALGFRNAAPTINGVNRWRVRSAIRTAHSYRADLVVFSGGSPAGHVEADLMADYAALLGYRGDVAQERESRTTQQNLRFSMPHLEAATRIVLVSNPLHAQRARADLWRTRPDLARLLAPSVDVRRGVWLIGVPIGTLYELAVRTYLRIRRCGSPLVGGRFKGHD